MEDAILTARLSVAKTPSAGDVVDLSVRSGHHLSSMITLVLRLLRLLPVLFGGHRQLALENLALCQQLAVYKRMMTRPDYAARTAFSGWGWLGSGPAGGSLSSS